MGAAKAKAVDLVKRIEILEQRLEESELHRRLLTKTLLELTVKIPEDLDRFEVTILATARVTKRLFEMLGQLAPYTQILDQQFDSDARLKLVELSDEATLAERAARMYRETFESAYQQVLLSREERRQQEAAERRAREEEENARVAAEKDKAEQEMAARAFAEAANDKSGPGGVGAEFPDVASIWEG